MFNYNLVNKLFQTRQFVLIPLTKKQKKTLLTINIV